MGCHCACQRTIRHHNIRDVYTIGTVLGSGAFGQVRSCTHNASQRSYAVKIMSKHPIQKKGAKPVDFVKMFRNEIEVLENLDHPNVIRYYEFFEDQHFLYAIMDKCEGGELFSKIASKKQNFTEKNASQICRDMLQSIRYLHQRKIVHRDIKAQNFLFQSTDEESRLIVIDFGMAATIENGEHLTRLCGSPHYLSPELLQRKYRFTVDMWAAGVILYLMIYGKYPYEGSNRESIMRKVAKFQPQFPKGPSELLLDFLKGLLHKDPEKRLNSEQAVEHPWLSPDTWETDEFEIPRGVRLAAERKMTLEKDVHQVRDFERKLTEMDERYRLGASSNLKSPPPKLGALRRIQTGLMGKRLLTDRLDTNLAPVSPPIRAQTSPEQAAGTKLRVPVIDTSWERQSSLGVMAQNAPSSSSSSSSSSSLSSAPPRSDCEEGRVSDTDHTSTVKAPTTTTTNRSAAEVDASNARSSEDFDVRQHSDAQFNAEPRGGFVEVQRSVDADGGRGSGSEDESTSPRHSTTALEGGNLSEEGGSTVFKTQDSSCLAEVQNNSSSALQKGRLLSELESPMTSSVVKTS